MRILEWNIGLKKFDAQQIHNQIDLLKNKADILVFTEVKSIPSDFTTIFNAYTIYSNTSIAPILYHNINDIVICVSKKCNLTSCNEITINSGATIHPDWRMIEITISSVKINLLGIRFQNHNINNCEKLLQIQTFYKLIEPYADNLIIIGDFNTNSSITFKGYSWSKFKATLKEFHLLYLDASSIHHTFSYQRHLTKRTDSIGTTPDNIFIGNKILSDLKFDKAFYYWGDDNWPADHAMLISDFNID